jgi:hypothetical protein
MKDERYKKIMEDLGMPNSRSLLVALQQVANEVSYEYEKKLNVVTQTLEDIINPITKLKRGLKDGEQLDGGYAIMLSKDPEYLRTMAQEALNKLK